MFRVRTSGSGRAWRLWMRARCVSAERISLKHGRAPDRGERKQIGRTPETRMQAEAPVRTASSVPGRIVSRAGAANGLESVEPVGVVGDYGSVQNSGAVESD